MQERIMLVDDEPKVFEGIQRALRKLRPNWDIETYVDPEDALKRAQTSLFDVFVSDFRMPRMNGVEFLRAVRSAQPESVRIILSGQVDVDALVHAVNESQIDRVILKPAKPFDLATTVDQALKHRRVLVENRRLADKVRRQAQEIEGLKSLAQL